MRFALLAAGRLVVVLVGVMASTWLVMRALRPDLYRGEPDPEPLALLRFLERIFLHLDFGVSGFGGREVRGLLERGVPADLSLLLGGLALGVLGGLALGAVAATRPRSLAGRAIAGWSVLALCAPAYFVALVLLVLFGDEIGLVAPLDVVPLKYVPFGESPGRWLAALLVPWTVVGAPLAAMVARATSASLHEVLDADPVRYAAAKGLSAAGVVRRHALPLALAPVLSLLSATTTVVVVNLVLVEQVFSVPGVFADLRRTFATMDLPVFFGVVFVAAAYSALMGLVLDLTLARLDPRVRRG